jgi:phage terminase small subunit
LTSRQERFCQEIVKGKSQSDAYRVAWKPKKAKAKTIHEAASRIMVDSKVTARIQALMKPLVEECQVTREQWLKKMERFYNSDIRKLFDEFGNPKDIHTLGDNEAAMIEGFEVVEDFTKVKKAETGEEQAVATGYTKKFKLTPTLKAMLEFGKVMGFYTERTEHSGVLTMKQLVSVIVTKEQRQEPKVING